MCDFRNGRFQAANHPSTSANHNVTINVPYEKKLCGGCCIFSHKAKAEQRIRRSVDSEQNLQSQ